MVCPNYFSIAVYIDLLRVIQNQYVENWGCEVVAIYRGARLNISIFLLDIVYTRRDKNSGDIVRK
jgi:hypothetical protein